MKALTPDEAAAQAIQLFSQDAKICERHPNKIARKQGNILSNKDSETSDHILCLPSRDFPTNDIVTPISDQNSKNCIKCNIPMLFTQIT